MPAVMEATLPARLPRLGRSPALLGDLNMAIHPMLTTNVTKVATPA
jgi:hypothetical protein